MSSRNSKTEKTSGKRSKASATPTTARSADDVKTHRGAKSKKGGKKSKKQARTKVDYVHLRDIFPDIECLPLKDPAVTQSPGAFAGRKIASKSVREGIRNYHNEIAEYHLSENNRNCMSALVLIANEIKKLNSNFFDQKTDITIHTLESALEEVGLVIPTPRAAVNKPPLMAEPTGNNSDYWRYSKQVGKAKVSNEWGRYRTVFTQLAETLAELASAETADDSDLESKVSSLQKELATEQKKVKRLQRKFTALRVAHDEEIAAKDEIIKEQAEDIKNLKRSLETLRLRLKESVRAQPPSHDDDESSVSNDSDEDGNKKDSDNITTDPVTDPVVVEIGPDDEE